jgi:hypothetical protein
MRRTDPGSACWTHGIQLGGRGGRGGRETAGFAGGVADPDFRFDMWSVGPRLVKERIVLPNDAQR